MIDVIIFLGLGTFFGVGFLGIAICILSGRISEQEREDDQCLDLGSDHLWWLTK